MNPLEKFLNFDLDNEILKLSSRNHKRRKYIRENVMTEELIRYCIEILDYSVYHICKEIFEKKGYKADPTTIISFCKEKGIKTYSIKERANNQSVRKKYRDTCNEKYGEPNSLSRGTIPYQKRNNTVKRKFGVDNVFQSEEIKEKSKKTMIERYGVWNNLLYSGYTRNHGRRSKIQIKIEGMLKEKNILFEPEIPNKFCVYNEKLGRVYSPIVDILIEDKKIVIEVNGDIWHANPNKYKSTDLICTWKGNLPTSEIWKFDKIRKEQIESFGYSVLTFWEYDIKNNIDKVKKIIDEKIFKN